VFDIKGESGSAFDKAEEYLTRTGPAKIDAFVSLESASGRDVGEAVKRAKAKGDAGRLVVAMDTDAATLQSIKDGNIDSTVSQKPYTMAWLGLKALDDIYHYPVKPLVADFALDPFSPFPALIDTGVALVDKNNVEAILTRKAAAGSE
jgi:ribose transport system substrate-binding protein